MTMLDIHYHLLPGVDDGPTTLQQSLDLSRYSFEDGVTHIIATPHCHDHLRLLRADILPQVTMMNDELTRAGIGVTVFPGSEIQLTNVENYQRDYLAGVYCHLGDDPRFTLLEFPWVEELYPEGAPEHVRWLRDHGTLPIIAHPERHEYFRQTPIRLRELVESGAWIQITVDSLLGNFGPNSLRAGLEFLSTYDDAVLASDSHSAHRRSGLSSGYRLVRDQFGEAKERNMRTRADAILTHLMALKVAREHK
jgi:protein-tyrosine phosphatase